MYVGMCTAKFISYQIVTFSKGSANTVGPLTPIFAGYK